MRAVLNPSLESRITALDWSRIEAELNQRGYATTGPVLGGDECAAFIDGYDAEDTFRSRVVMARHSFGLGEYKYYDYPLPDPVAELRTALYARLSGVANRWHQDMKLEQRFPDNHADYLTHCHGVGQIRPTALILKYGTGDYNCLHRDLYGDEVFPLQAAFQLSAPGEDFTGGEFVLTEQRPRMQSRVEVVSTGQGEGVIFAVNQRPVEGKRGTYRVALRHGVSPVRSGQRFTLGIIMHDAT